MSDIIWNFTVCLVNRFFIPIIEIRNKQGRCPNLAVCPNIPDFTILRIGLSRVNSDGRINSDIDMVCFTFCFLE